MEVACQFRRLAWQLERIADCFAAHAAAVHMDQQLVEADRLAASIAVTGSADLDGELEALTQTIESWRRGLVDLAWDERVRSAASEHAGDWAERLTWVASLFEAADA